jgi:hypothetical protein
LTKQSSAEYDCELYPRGSTHHWGAYFDASNLRRVDNPGKSSSVCQNFVEDRDNSTICKDTRELKKKSNKSTREKTSTAIPPTWKGYGSKPIILDTKQHRVFVDTTLGHFLFTLRAIMRQSLSADKTGGVTDSYDVGELQQVFAERLNGLGETKR